MNHIDSPWPAVLLAALAGVWGLGWGLPSAERTKLFMKPELQNEAFYKQVEKARDDYYNQIGINPMAHVGRMAREGKGYQQSTNILSSYSSYLVRSHHGDEQANLVMLSHLNPLQGKWYPYSYAYGGAYIYPLACYLGVLHVLHMIHLVGQASFYYAHPEQIAKIYLAVRSWSLWGLIAAVIALFYVGRRVGGPWIGFWASCFFALMPACIGTAKMAKPHVWAAAWTLCAILACIHSKEDKRLRVIVLAAVCYGAALGTTLSQTAFFPFLIWACWTASPKTTILRGLVVGAVTAGVFLATNFYLFAHFQDFQDELYFLKQLTPFGVRLGALWEFAYGALRPSFGSLFWGLWIAGTLWSLLQKTNKAMRALGLLSLPVFAYLSFQVQSQASDPVTSRLCLALIGIGCVLLLGLLRTLPRATGLCVVGLLLLIGKTILYDLNFVSDQAPRDNASLAGLWMSEHIPAGALIGHVEVIPHVIEFPPVDFSRYRIVPFNDATFTAATGVVYALIPDWAVRPWRQRLLDQHFVLLKRFAESPLQKLGTYDPFTTANFAVEIYERGT